jgi:hypothetical protein
MRQQPNYTCMLKNLLNLYCIRTWDTFLYFGFFFLLFWIFFLLMRWQNYFWDTISRIGGWGTNTKIIKTEILLHLNLEIFILFYLFYFIYFYFFNPLLCLYNACLDYCWLVHYLSLFISLTRFCLFCFVCLFVFPFFFIFFAFPLLSPFHSKNHHCYYYKLEYT